MPESSAITRKIAANAAKKLNEGRSITASEQAALEQVEREQSAAKQPKLGLAANMGAASVKVGSTVRVLRALKKAGSKAFTASGRIDCDVLAAELKAGPVAEPVLTESELLVRERRMALADKRARANREHLHIDEVTRTCTRMVTGAKSRLLATPSNVVIAMKAEGLSEPHAVALRRILEGELREFCEAMTRGDWFAEV